MPNPDHPSAAWRFILSAVTLIGCVIGLTVALLSSLATADHYLQRSARSLRQAGAVTQIEATAVGVALMEHGARASHDALDAELRQQLADYRRSIVSEQASLRHAPPPGDLQRAEADDADLLSALAMRVTSASGAVATTTLGDLRSVVERIVARERGESREVAAALAALRIRTMVVGFALAALASILAIVAGVAMLTANSRLQREVGERTAELEGKNARLADVDRSRRLFYAKLSHELRTPVTVMRGEAEVALRLHDDAAAMRGVLGHVVANAGVLDRRLDELLGLARAEDGQLMLEARAFDVGAMIVATGATALPFASSSEVALAVTVPAAPLIVVGDARWLGQAVLTIIDNGVKFSRTGLRVDASADAGRARITVADDGAGIDDSDLSRVFEPWYQAPGSGNGVGLGLALARWIVEQQGGTITAANAATGGCVVTIELPLAA